jgi:hypothetical protein
VAYPATQHPRRHADFTSQSEVTSSAITPKSTQTFSIIGPHLRTVGFLHTRICFRRITAILFSFSASEKARALGPGIKQLSTKTKTLDQRAVTVDVDLLQVIEKTTTITDHQKQTTTGVVIVLVGLEMLGQIGDTLAQQRDLNLGRSRITLVRRVLRDNFVLLLSRKCHGILLWLLRGAAGPVPERSLSAGEFTPSSHYTNG